jgi:hypothetical protein
MLPRWRSDVLGGALSLSIHALFIGVTMLLALDQALPPAFPSSADPAFQPVTLVFPSDPRDRFLFDGEGTKNGWHSPRGSRNPGVFMPLGGYRATSEALAPALAWLVRHQNEDGSWSVDRFERHCKGERCGGTGGRRCDDCVTALAVLALKGADPERQPDGVAIDPAVVRRQRLVRDAVAQGMNWLCSRRKYYGGCLGARPLANRLVFESWSGPLFLKMGGVPAAVMDSQKIAAGECRDGSWDPESSEENRAYVVALNTLRLEGHPGPESLLGKCEGGYR